MAGHPENASLPCPSCGANNSSDSPACSSCGASLTAAPRIEPGTVLGRRYEIQEVLGSGGMGMVLKAYDRELDETVAVKVLRADLARSEEIARRFRTEIKLARRVRHHNVCGIHEYGSDGGISYIAMELIRGTDLKHLIKRKGALRAEEAFDVCIQIAEGLQAIHDAGIIHRDLKTSNVMLDPKGRVALMDFGIAKDTQQSVALGATAVGQLIGTPEYMSPEQARGQQIDTRSDLYALGIIVFEVFSGHVPFQGTTPIATLFKNLEEAPPLEGAIAAGIPRPVIPVCAKALAKAPAERFQSAREMADALLRARAETLGPGHTPVPRTGSFDGASTLTLPSPGPPPAQPTLASAPTAVPSPTAVQPPTPVPPPTVAGADTDTIAGPQPETLVALTSTLAVPTPPPRTPPAPARTPPPLPPTPPPLPLRSPMPGPVWRKGVSPAAAIGAAAVLAVGVLVTGWLVVSRGERAGDGPAQLDLTTVATPAPAPPSTEPPATAVPGPPPTEPLATAVPGPPPTVPPGPEQKRSLAARGSVTPLPSTPEPTPTTRPPIAAPLVTVPTPPPAKALASLQVRVRPWAQVSVDNQVVGTTPFAPLALSPGPHYLEFVHPDYKPLRRKVTLTAGQTLKVDLDLTLDAVPK